MIGPHLIRGLTAFHLLLYLRPAEAIVGYDCNGATLNITTVSLVEVGGCDIPLQEVNETPVLIQLLQINQYSEIRVRQCKLEIHRIVRRCGMWSHGMDVPNGVFSYIEDVSRDTCNDLFRYGSMKIGQTTINGITVNATTSRSISLAGSLSQDSECHGVHYSDPYGTWDKVYVFGEARITLHEGTVNVDVDTNKVHLHSGARCELSEGRCTDIYGANTYWDPLPEDSCNSKRYGVLYEGKAIRTTDRKYTFKQTIYSVLEGSTIFSLAARDRTNVCGFTLIRTEHPKLLVVEVQKEQSFVKKDPLAVVNLDLFTYVNSKFVYVEKHVQNQLQHMYNDILVQRCNLERQVIKNTIGLAKNTPDEFAYNIMKGPGYMAVIAGEVAHIIKCIAIDVSIIETKECYTQLPVTAGNISYYLTPGTHILKKTGTQITCNNLVSPMYQIGGVWYMLTPRPVSTVSPTVLQPLTKQTWTYRNPQTLATSGIYTQKDLDDLRDHIMFPAERPAILNSVARGIAGQPTITQGGTIANLIDERAINKIIKNSWEKSWGYFATFGTFSAGLIGIVMCIRGIKLVIDTVIHGYALHTVYGWSLYLIGAVWDSVTHLLLHISKKPPKGDGDNNGDGKASEKPLLPENASERCPTCAPSSPYAETVIAPLTFGFDPRILELNQYPTQRDNEPSTSMPVRAYPGDAAPSHFNPGHQTEYQTLPRSHTWNKEKSVKRDRNHYKVPRRLSEHYSIPSNYMVMASIRPSSPPRDVSDPLPPIASVRMPTLGENQNGIKNNHGDSQIITEENPPIEEVKKCENEIQRRTLYPTLEKVKTDTSSLLSPSETKQMFLSLEKQTHH